MSAWMLSLEPERRKTDGSPPRHATWGDHLGFCATLKLLAASVVQRRNVPPFSKVSKQWPRSFGLRSDAPSQASFPSLTAPHRTRVTDPPTAGPGRGSLEDLFHFVVVVPIETTNLLQFFRALQLSVHVAILRTVAALNAQPTVGPELPLATEAVRCLHQGEQAGGPNRTDAGYLPQQFRGFMFPALRQ